MPRKSLLLLAALGILALSAFGCKRARQQATPTPLKTAAAAGQTGASRRGATGRTTGASRRAARAQTVALTLKLPKGWQDTYAPKPRPDGSRAGCPASQVSTILGISLSSTHGCVVGATRPGGAAERAGVQVGDAIVECNGGKVECPSSLDPLIWITQNDTLKLVVKRPAAEVRRGDAAKAKTSTAAKPVPPG